MNGSSASRFSRSSLQLLAPQGRAQPKNNPFPTSLERRKTMKSTLGMCLLALMVASAAPAQQDPTKPVLRKGISVQMPVSNQAREMREADEEDATVIAVTSDGNLFVGVQPVQLSSLSQLNAPTVYVKADARVPYQKLLTVLDALRGHSVILLTSSPSSGQSSQITWPYGVKVMLGGQ